MRAIVMSEHGGPEVLKYAADFPAPEPGAGEVLVKVEASGLNRIDLVVRQGYPGIGIPLPHIPGGDIAGAVAELGDGAGGIEQGARVLVYPLVACHECPLCMEGKPNLCVAWKYFGMHLAGGYAGYVAVPSENLIALPDTVSFEDAVSLPVAGLTAFHALKTVGELREGQTFFIWGGAGALGTIAIQVAKQLGATVIATGGSEEKLELMKALGADHVLNRRTEDVPARVKEIAPAGVDLVLEYVGPETFPQSFEMLKKGGCMMLCGMITGRETPLNLQLTYLKHLSIKGLYLGTKEELTELLGWMAEGRVKAQIGRRFALEEAAEAQRVLASGEVAGKIVLQI
ncbi:zinc-binding dehydrogenase [bacterium]|nr:zinc-binding dehydrogenase [bacterium]